MRRLVLVLLLLAITTVNAHDLLIDYDEPPAAACALTCSDTCSDDTLCTAHSIMHQAIFHALSDTVLATVTRHTQSFDYRIPGTADNTPTLPRPPRLG